MSEYKIKMVLHPHVYKYVLIVRLVIENITELSVGGSTFDLVTGGVSDNVVAKTYVKVPRNNEMRYEIVPFIPSSTLKGALRSVYEDKIKNESKCKASLSDVLKKLLQYIENNVVDHTEIVDKLMARIYMQFIDEELVMNLISMLKDKGKFKEFVNALENKDLSKLNSLTNEAFPNHRDLAEDLAEILINISSSYMIYADVCDPTIEGLVCELPVPLYKILLKESIAKACEGDIGIEYPCKVCRLFGLPGYRSRITLTNAWPLDIDKVAVLSRTHIAIDRVRGAVSQGKTYQVEYIAPGAEFEFYIVYEMYETPQAQGNELTTEIKNYINGNGGLPRVHSKDIEFIEALRTIINALNNGLRIGRKKTINYGLVKLKEYDILAREGAPPSSSNYIPQDRMPLPLNNLRLVNGFLKGDS